MEFNKEDLERKITLKVGDKAPNFTLQNSDGVAINLSDFVGKNIVLYFYPKDNTPGCTKEACEFSDIYANFIARDFAVIGISPDSTTSHAKFSEKFGLKHILLSDENKEVAKLYGVYQVRKNYGREYLGIVRSTFIIDKTGKISKIYKSVKAAGHAQKVFDDANKE